VVFDPHSSCDFASVVTSTHQPLPLTLARRSSTGTVLWQRTGHGAGHKLKRADEHLHEATGWDTLLTFIQSKPSLLSQWFA
jgi:hypothetical protein